MFYVLSKILYPLVAPISLIIIFFLLYLITGIKRQLYIGITLLLFFSNPYISQSVMKAWEIEGVSIKPNQKYDAIIILGGFASVQNIKGEIRPVFADGNDRMIQAITLYKNGVSNKIIYTAGTDSIFYLQQPEAILGRNFMLKCGIPDSSIWVEPKSINTHENALFTRELLALNDSNWQNKNYLIVTSAFHMRRALACFEKVGFKNLTPYGTDFRSIRNKNTLINTLMPTYGGIENWTYLLKEFIGMVVYKFKGYI